MPPRTLADAVAELLEAEAERVANSARRDRLRVEVADLSADLSAPASYATTLGEVTIYPPGVALLAQVSDEGAFANWVRIHHPGCLRAVEDPPGSGAGYVEVASDLLEELVTAGELRRYPDGTVILFDAEGRPVDGISGTPSSFGLGIALNPKARAAARLAGAGLDPTLAELQA